MCCVVLCMNYMDEFVYKIFPYVQASIGWMLQSTLQRKIVKVSSPFIFCSYTHPHPGCFGFFFIFVYQLYGFLCYTMLLRNKFSSNKVIFECMSIIETAKYFVIKITMVVCFVSKMQGKDILYCTLSYRRVSVLCCCSVFFLRLLVLCIYEIIYV